MRLLTLGNFSLLSPPLPLLKKDQLILLNKHISSRTFLRLLQWREMKGVSTTIVSFGWIVDSCLPIGETQKSTIGSYWKIKCRLPKFCVVPRKSFISIQLYSNKLVIYAIFTKNSLYNLSCIGENLFKMLFVNKAFAVDLIFIFCARRADNKPAILRGNF